MKQENFLNYRNFRWLKISAACSALLLAIYLYDKPIGGASGDTVLGYTYGALATIAVCYLMYYGMRKRSYFASRSTLLGVLSAHTWLGIGLLLLVPLHAGFSFSFSLHTLTYVLLCLVVLSGIWGAYLYINLPAQLSSQRGGVKVKDLLCQIKTLDQEIGKKAKKLDKQDLVIFSDLDHLGRMLGILYLCCGRAKAANKERYASFLAQAKDEDQEQLLLLISLLTKRDELLQQLRSEMRTQYFLRLWLYFHVPLSFAMFAAMLIHIFSVFYNY